MSSFFSRNIAVMGIPRSGTTLVCDILNQQSNTYALVEPIARLKFFSPQKPASELLGFVNSFFLRQRENLAAHGKARSRSIRGVPVANIFSARVNRRTGLRQYVGRNALASFPRPADDTFTLVVKHPILFTVLYDVLREHFSCYAIIRNPLDVLKSWATINAPFRLGNAQFVKEFCPELKERLAEAPPYAKQVVLLDWFYRTYFDKIPAERIIKYETMIETGGACLQPLSGSEEPIQYKKPLAVNEHLYKDVNVVALKEVLLAHAVDAWRFYDRGVLDEKDRR